MLIYNACGDINIKNKIIEQFRIRRTIAPPNNPTQSISITDVSNTQSTAGENDDLKLISYDMIKDKKSIIYKVEDDKISGFLTFNYIDKYYKSTTDALKVSFTGNNLKNSKNSKISITCYYFINNKVFEYDENYKTSNKIDISLENNITFNLDSDIAAISKDNIINEYEVIDMPISEFIIRKKAFDGFEDQLIKLKTVEEKINPMQYKRELYFEILSEEKDKAILTKNGDKYGQIQGMGINSYMEIYAVKQKTSQIKSEPNIEEFNILILSKSYQIEFTKEDILELPNLNSKLSYTFNWFKNTNGILLKDGGILNLMDIGGIDMLTYKNKSLNKNTYAFFINVKGRLKHIDPSEDVGHSIDSYNINFYENSLYLTKFYEHIVGNGVQGFTFSDDLFSKDNFTIDDLYFKITEDDIESKFEAINFGMGKYKVKMNSELNDKIDDKEIDIESLPLFLNVDNDKFQIIDDYAINRDTKIQLYKYTQNSEDKQLFILTRPNSEHGPIYYDIIEFTEYDQVESLAKFKETIRLPPCEECPKCEECPECPKSEENKNNLLTTLGMDAININEDTEEEAAEESAAEESASEESEGSGISNRMILVLLLFLLLGFYYFRHIREY